MTFSLALDAASPPGLSARHVYLAPWLGATERIFRQFVPFIFVITKSGELSMFCSSLYQDIVGDGMPVTWHSNINGAPSITSTDLRFLVKSGGTIC